MRAPCRQTVTVMQGQKLRKLKLVACVAICKREMGTEFMVRCAVICWPVLCHIYGSISNFINGWYLGNQFLLVPHQQAMLVWGHNTRACICNTLQRSAILRWICMWRAELDTNLSLTIPLHNQGNLHAWVLLKVSVISYFLSRWWGRGRDAAAGHGWATLETELSTKALSCRKSRAASPAQVKKSHGGNLSSIEHCLPLGHQPESSTLSSYAQSVTKQQHTHAVKHLLSWLNTKTQVIQSTRGGRAQNTEWHHHNFLFLLVAMSPRICILPAIGGWWVSRAGSVFAPQPQQNLLPMLAGKPDQTWQWCILHTLG